MLQEACPEEQGMWCHPGAWHTAVMVDACTTHCLLYSPSHPFIRKVICLRPQRDKGKELKSLDVPETLKDTDSPFSSQDLSPWLCLSLSLTIDSCCQGSSPNPSGSAFVLVLDAPSILTGGVLQSVSFCFSSFSPWFSSCNKPSIST